MRPYCIDFKIKNRIAFYQAASFFFFHNNNTMVTTNSSNLVLEPENSARGGNGNHQRGKGLKSLGTV